jgi:hypothetical protein
MGVLAANAFDFVVTYVWARNGEDELCDLNRQCYEMRWRQDVSHCPLSLFTPRSIKNALTIDTRKVTL